MIRFHESATCRKVIGMVNLQPYFMQHCHSFRLSATSLLLVVSVGKVQAGSVERRVLFSSLDQKFGMLDCLTFKDGNGDPIPDGYLIH